MSIIGHFLLFSPIISILSFIPLVGHLLGAIFTFAAAIFAFVWASALHCLIMGTSWLFYRPVYGIILLSGVIISIFLMSYGSGSDVQPAVI